MKTQTGLLSVVTEDFSFDRGHPLPLGATVMRGGVNFSLFSRYAEEVTLVLFKPGEETEIAAFPLDNKRNRTGNVWHAFIAGLDPGVEYAYRIDGPKSSQHSFNPDNLVADPYAVALNGSRKWGDSSHPHDSFCRALLVNREYDWEFDQPINRPLSDSIIYEVHVRGFTRDHSSGTKFPGTFRGLIEKIPYLKELGVTAVELLPITEFDELDIDRCNPEDGSRLYNFWGYHPLSFFAIKAAYSADTAPGSEIDEFKDMVKALHAAGIEVILDVVYNHTGEGNHLGPTFSMKGIDNCSYYMLSEDRYYMNFSGCGNTVNCNHPYVRNFILDSLRYWVTEMHVDGFRFDLASILGRDQSGNVLASPPLLEQIAGDPVLADTKLIAEAWDAAGLYQVGTFPNWGRWAEWNGRFRDDIRRFVCGAPGMARSLATRLAGSSDLFQHGREPGHGINFITSHDGFSLRDLVSYNHKQNWNNGENNCDGDDNNNSWNCGIEGPSSDPEVVALRERQIRNLITLLILSRGVPMILAGDEIGRTIGGNNNAYCQDNSVNWLSWKQRESNQQLFRFFRLLIAFRRNHNLLRYDKFTVSNGYGVSISWHGFRAGAPDWSDESRSLAMHLSGNTPRGPAPDMYLIANAHWESHDFELPSPCIGTWHRFIDTSMRGDDAIVDDPGMHPLDYPASYLVSARSTVVLIAM